MRNGGNYMNSETMREHYKEQILDVVCSHGNFAINRKNNEIVSCCSINCWECLFRNNCIANRAKWANSPYKPPFDEKKWVAEWYKKYLNDNKVIGIYLGRFNVTAIIDRYGKTGISKCRKTDSYNPQKGVAIAYARYCGEEIPKEL